MLGTGGRGIFAESGGGAISIQGVGVLISNDATSGAVRGTMGHGIHADARGTTAGTGSSITIGGSGDGAIGAVTGSLRGIHAPTDGEGSAITIDSSQAAVVGGAGHGIWADNDGTGAVTITSAAVTGSGTASDGINATLGNVSASANLSITASGTVTGGDDGIYARHDGTGRIAITAASVIGTAVSAFRRFRAVARALVSLLERLCPAARV